MRPLFAKTIKGKIILSTMLFSFILSMLIAISSYKVYHDYLQSSLLQSSELSLQVIADSISKELKNIYSLADWCQMNDSIGEFALYGSKTPKQKLTVHDYLNERYNSNSSAGYIQRVLVASNRGEFIQIVQIRHSSASDVFSVVSGLDYFSKALEGELANLDIGFVYDPFRAQSQISILPLIRPIYSLYDSSIAGWVFISISPQLFINAVDAYQHGNGDAIYLTLGKKTYSIRNGEYTPVPSLESKLVKDERTPALYQDTMIFLDPELKEFYVSRPLSTEGCYIMQRVDNHELISQTTFFIRVLMAICLIILLAGLFMSLLLNRMVNKPVLKIQETMNRIANGDFSREASIEWDNEFGDIGRGINKLSESIHTLMHSRLEMEKQKRDYEFQMLQSQINPHFLYNTLMSIKWMATIQNAPGIAEMTTSLSRLLKNIAKGTAQFVPLSEELDLLKDYFTIMKYRYGGTIDLSIRVDDDELLGCRILRLTLQPIVENAIFHGIEPKGAAGKIEIHIFRNNENDLLIDITDDGIGMDEETARKLLSEKTESKSSFFKKIGISNVHHRIQMEFGSAYGLSIRSKAGSYTTVTILLPNMPCADVMATDEEDRKRQPCMDVPAADGKVPRQQPCTDSISADEKVQKQ